MTHLQRALAGNAKKAVGGMLTHGHLYREALKELEERFGSDESVAGAHLKTFFDHSEVCEDKLCPAAVLLQHATCCCFHPEEFELRT